MQRVLNYGSFLQAYSLKQMIEELGGEVQFVDYRVKGLRYCGQSRMEMFLSKFNAFKIENKNAFLRTATGKFIREKVFRHPPYKHILEEKFFPEQRKIGICNKRNYRPRLDVLVIGSDEVFNCLQESYNVGFSPELFGACNRATKLISYAASFGNTTNEKLEECNLTKKISSYLSCFDALSVRDNNSGMIAKALTDKAVEYHLDPVLVGDFETIKKDDVKIKDYIILYAYDNRFTREEGEAVKAFAAQRKKKLIAMCGKQKFCDEYIVCDPSEVLAYFKHADCIITDTFHGSIFSIINQKPFVTIIRDSNNGEYGNREKLEDLLNRLNLQERILTDIQSIQNLMDRPIDYELAEHIRKESREKSLSYLKKFVCEKQEDLF